MKWMNYIGTSTDSEFTFWIGEPDRSITCYICKQTSQIELQWVLTYDRERAERLLGCGATACPKCAIEHIKENWPELLPVVKEALKVIDPEYLL